MISKYITRKIQGKYNHKTMDLLEINKNVNKCKHIHVHVLSLNTTTGDNSDRKMCTYQAGTQCFCN